MFNDENEFALRLSRLRNIKGVSARDMSLCLGCNASYINNIENGKALPSMKTFFAICDFLEIEPADFFDLENWNPQLICKIRRNLQELDETSFDVIDLLIQHLQE